MTPPRIVQCASCANAAFRIDVEQVDVPTERDLLVGPPYPTIDGLTRFFCLRCGAELNLSEERDRARVQRESGRHQ